MEDPLHEQFTYFEMSKKLLSLIYNPVYDAVVILKRRKKKDSLLFFPQPINYRKPVK